MVHLVDLLRLGWADERPPRGRAEGGLPGVNVHRPIQRRAAGRLPIPKREGGSYGKKRSETTRLVGSGRGRDRGGHAF